MNNHKRSFTTKAFAMLITCFLFVPLLAAAAGAEQETDPGMIKSDTGSVSLPVLIQEDFGNYLGYISEDHLVGEGLFSFTEGIHFNGQWDEIERTGTGKLILPGIGTYSGTFKDHKRDGEGTFAFDDGSFYTGSWEADAMQGEGTLILADGTELAGLFSKNRLFTGSIKKKMSLGEFSRTVTGGKLGQTYTLLLTDGTLYEGQVKKGTFNGKCTIKYANGDTYVGAIKENQKQGTGTYTWRDGASYTGAWKDDKMNGTGTYRYNADKNGPYLKGKFVNNSPNGTCYYFKVLSNGKYYKYKTVWEKGKCITISR